MPIHGVQSGSTMPAHNVSVLSKSAPGGFSGSFQQQLGDQRREQNRQRIDALFDELTEQSETILQRMDLTRFEHYRELIRQLLGELVQGAYTAQTDRVFDRYGRSSVYTTVHIIDEKLDALAAEVIAQSSKPLAFIDQIDEIRGLVTDLLT